MTIIFTLNRDENKYGSFERRDPPAVERMIKEVIKEIIIDEISPTIRGVSPSFIKRADTRHGKARPINLQFRKAWKAAEKRSIGWSIKLTDYQKLVSQNCHYCGDVVRTNGVSLDRKDNLKGYTLDNVVPCCAPCNKIKNNILTYDEMVVAMKAIVDYRRIKG